MTRIFSYVLPYDTGLAPNPFWGVCTLTVCKPGIRRTALVGDWVIGLRSSRVIKGNDGKLRKFPSDSVVYAMKITEIKTLAEYDAYCNQHLSMKIPAWDDPDWRRRVGDCIYDYSRGEPSRMRKGAHDEGNRDKDEKKGKYALLSDHFYYFGDHPEKLPDEIQVLIKWCRNYIKIEDQEFVEKFEDWINQFTRNKLYADPQMKWKFDGCGCISGDKTCGGC